MFVLNHENGSLLMYVPEEVFSAKDLAIFYKTLLPVRTHHQKSPTAFGKLFNFLGFFPWQSSSGISGPNK